MRWRGRRQSSNIEDRRSAGMSRGRMVRRAGGGSIGLIIVAVIGGMVFGVDPSTILGLLGGGGAAIEQPAPSPGGQKVDRDGEKDDFAAVVLAETEDVWKRLFKKAGSTYPATTMVFFTGQINSACGFASAASGPFYCPGDKKVYIDLSFFDEMKQKFRADGDFAQAYVIAHEVGHHIQNLTGVLPEFNRARRAMSEVDANKMSVRVELQADCYAGVWAHFTDQKGLLERGDIDEALNAAHQIGDDTLQKRSQGYVVPDAFNHGTSAQRARWFHRGYKDGDIGDCDTLNARDL